MSPNSAILPFDRDKMRAAFEAAVDSYDAAAQMQREIGSRLFERLELLKIQPQVVVDLGCGTGYFTTRLQQRYPKSTLVALDIAHSMVAKTRSQFSWLQRTFSKHHYICADAERIPLADASCDLIFSNLTFQWCHDLQKLFSEIQRILKPGGVLMFATLGPDTLYELRKSWSQVDDKVHVNQFVDMHDIGDAMIHSGLGDPVIDMEKLVMTYEDVMLLMKDIKAIGAHNVNVGRHVGLTGRGTIRAMQQAYEQYKNEEGFYPVTYEAIYGHAWKGEKRIQKDSGEFAIGVDAIGRANG